jgi:hypothetical protein
MKYSCLLKSHSSEYLMLPMRQLRSIISELSEVGRKKARPPLMDAERTDDIVLHNPKTQL